MLKEKNNEDVDGVVYNQQRNSSHSNNVRHSFSINTSKLIGEGDDAKILGGNHPISLVNLDSEQ